MGEWRGMFTLKKTLHQKSKFLIVFFSGGGGMSSRKEKSEQGGEGQKNTVDTNEEAAKISKEFLLKLKEETNLLRWKEIFNTFTKEMQKKFGENYSKSRTKVYIDTLQQHLFTGTRVKENYKSGIELFVKTFNIPFTKESSNSPNINMSSLANIRELTPEEEKNMQSSSKIFLETAVKNGERLTFGGNIEERVFRSLENDLIKKYPNIPLERIKIYIANLKGSIKKSEETFAGTSSKAIAYESLNWTLKNVPGARTIQEYVGKFLKEHGIGTKEIDEKTRKAYVSEVYDSLPTSIIPIPNQTIRNLIRGFIDMAIDTKKVTIEGGEFQNTAVNALSNIIETTSSKNIGETVKVGATKKDMKTLNFEKIFEDGAANVNSKDFEALMFSVSQSGMVQNKLAFLKNQIGENRYKEFCLYVSSMNFQTTLVANWDMTMKNQIIVDAKNFEESFRKGIGKMEMVTSSEELQGFPMLQKIYNENPELVNTYFQNPDFEGLRNIIKNGKIPEKLIDELLGEIQGFSQKKKQGNLIKIKEIPNDVLKTKITINGKEKSIGKLNTDEIRALQLQGKRFPEEIESYFQLATQNKNFGKAEGIAINVKNNVRAKNILAKSIKDESLVQKPEYIQIAEKANTAGNIRGFQSEIEIIAVANGIDPKDVSDPGKIEELLKNYSGQLSREELEVYKSIQEQHHRIGEQVSLMHHKYGKEETENILKGDYEEGHDTSLLMKKYIYLNNYVYTPDSNGNNNEYFQNIIANMKPGNPDFPIAMPLGNGNTEVYYIGVSDPINRIIRDKRGTVILTGIPISDIESTMQQLAILESLGMGNLGSSLQIINNVARIRGNKDLTPGTTLEQKDLAFFLEILIRLFDFPNPPVGLSGNASELERYIKLKTENLGHSLQEQGRRMNIYDTDGNPNIPSIEKRLQVVNL